MCHDAPCPMLPTQIHNFVFTRIQPSNAALVPAMLKWLKLEFGYWAAQRRIAQLSGEEASAEAIAASPTKRRQPPPIKAVPEGDEEDGKATPDAGDGDIDDSEAGRKEDGDSSDGKEGGVDEADLETTRRLETLGRVVDQLGTIQVRHGIAMHSVSAHCCHAHHCWACPADSWVGSADTAAGGSGGQCRSRGHAHRAGTRASPRHGACPSHGCT